MAQPQLDEGGARWDVGPSDSRHTDPDSGEYRAEGTYADVSHRSDTIQDSAVGDADTDRSTPPDTQAVLDAMPVAAAAPGSSAAPPESGNRPAPSAGDNLDSGLFCAEVDEPGGATHGEDGAQLTAGDYNANRDSINAQVGEADYVQVPEEEPAWIDIAAENERWNAMLEVDRRSFTGWSRHLRGMKRWKSPTQRAGKGVRFGDVRFIAAAGEDGRVVRVADGWVSTRQPGFGRRAPVPGEFPFSVREQTLKSLIEGPRVGPRGEGRRHGGRSGHDWRKMANLLVDLHVAGMAQTPAFEASFDEKTLGKLVDLFESAVTLA